MKISHESSLIRTSAIRASWLVVSTLIALKLGVSRRLMVNPVRHQSIIPQSPNRNSRLRIFGRVHSSLGEEHTPAKKGNAHPSGTPKSTPTKMPLGMPSTAAHFAFSAGGASLIARIDSFTTQKLLRVYHLFPMGMRRNIYCTLQPFLTDNLEYSLRWRNETCSSRTKDYWYSENLRGLKLSNNTLQAERDDLRAENEINENIVILYRGQSTRNCKNWQKRV
jgi:hypothetical protein